MNDVSQQLYTNEEGESYCFDVNPLRFSCDRKFVSLQPLSWTDTFGNFKKIGNTFSLCHHLVRIILKKFSRLIVELGSSFLLMKMIFICR